MILDAISVVVLGALGMVVIVMAALLERSGPVRVRHWAEEAGGSLLALFEAPGRFEGYRFLLSALAKAVPVLLVVALRALCEELRLAYPAAWALAGVLGLVAVLELVNRRLVATRAEETLERLTVLYRLFLLLLTPLVTLSGRLAMRRPPAPEEPEPEVGEDTISDEEVEAYIELGTREGILEPGEEEYVWGIVDFGDTQVRSVMTPRVDMVVASADAELDELAERFLESGYSRIPLYEESIDRIAGILHIRELLRGLRSDPRPLARDLAKPAMFVPERKPLDELLREMQARFQQVAIVLDEYGGTAGLVTVEDLLEEIVGEIFDEDEVAEEEPAPAPLADGSWRLDGRVHIDVLDELFDLDLEEEPYETVGGLVLAACGYVPAEGETVEHHGLRFTVEDVTGRRVRTVRVEPVVEPATPAEEAEEVS
ncbi:MAG TPA: hemolysin family protein [Thermoanaerobaculia bacterium]|nr:hemolysin family protein [Thermoanaerobaculia bacterium]